MIKLGVNTVLFGQSDIRTAMERIKWAGFDVAEIAALPIANHLPLEGNWGSHISEIKKISTDLQLPIVAMEAGPATGEEKLKEAIEAAVLLGISFINTTPGNTKPGNAEDLKKIIDSLNKMAELANKDGVTICFKAHVNSAVHNTKSMQEVLKNVNSPGFGADIDASHMFRVGENPAHALKKIYSRIEHVHIRDCAVTQGTDVGEPYTQACGRGKIDLMAFLKVLVDKKYDGPVNLEVIGTHNDPKTYTIDRCAMIAAETYGYLNACLKKLGAR